MREGPELNPSDTQENEYCLEEAVQLSIVVGVDFASRPFVSDIGEPAKVLRKSISGVGAQQESWGGGFPRNSGEHGNGSQPLATEMSKNRSRQVVKIPDF